MLNDITTDLTDPPRFVLQRGGPAHFDPAKTAAHRDAYPGLAGGAVLAMPRDEAFRRAVEACEAAGWHIVARDLGAGQIEAVATTRLLRFKDDIAVRLRSAGDARTQVDMRSRSRVGRSDLGTNARRIRRFLSQLTG